MMDPLGVNPTAPAAAARIRCAARSLLPILALAALLGALAFAAAGVWALRQAAEQHAPTAARIDDPLAPEPGLEGLHIPDFALNDQAGEPATRDELFSDAVTVVDFIFTNCPFICPPMTRNMRALQDRLAGSGVRFVSFSVDPQRDSPEALRAFAAKHGADLATWTFLTGDLEQVQRILTQGLRLDAIAPLPQTPIKLADGTTMANLRHPSHFALVGPDAQVLALTIGTQPSLHEEFAKRAEAAAQALRSGRSAVD